MAILAGAVDYAADILDLDRISASKIQALPLPIVIWGIAYDLRLELFLEGIEGIGSPYYVMGALTPEGGYMEPTRGQIWPRIG